MKKLLYLFDALSVLFLHACGGSKTITKTGSKKTNLVHLNSINKKTICNAADIWHGKSSILAISEKKGNVDIYTLPILDPVITIKVSKKPIRALCIINAGRTLAVVTAYKQIKFFSIISGKKIEYFKSKTDRDSLRGIESISYNIKKDLIALGTSNGKIVLISKDRSLFTKKTSYKTVRVVSFSKSGKILAYSGNKNSFSLFMVNALVLKKTVSTEGPVISFAFSPDDNICAVGTLFWKLYFIKVSNMKLSTPKNLDYNPVKSLAFSPGGKLVFAGIGKVSKGQIRIYSIKNRSILSKFYTKSREIIFLGFSGKMLVSVSADGKIAIYSVILQNQLKI